LELQTYSKWRQATYSFLLDGRKTAGEVHQVLLDQRQSQRFQEEILVWAGRDQSEIRILSKSKSHDILNSLWANRLATGSRDKDIISARVQAASEYFEPDSDGLDRFLVLGRASLSKASRLSSSYEILKEDVSYLDQGFWLYTATLTIVWQSPEGVQDSETIDISIRWIPTRGASRNQMAKAIAASKLEVKSSK
jgi:hypothetical protein